MYRLALILIFILVIGTPPAVRAANATVGTGSGASCTEPALQAAVAAVNSGGGTITFNCGGAATIPLTGQLRFDTAGAKYVIDGGNLITLDGQGATRLIYSASGRGLRLTVKNITLINGYAASDAPGERANNQGGAIYSGYENSLTVKHVTFDNNRAAANYHPNVHGGGAIAIDTTSVVTVSDSVFTGNSAPNGGAINNLLSRLTIERSLFRDNHATFDEEVSGGGGAIYNNSGRLTITGSHLLSNSSATLGGAIFSLSDRVNGSYSGKTTVKNTVIDGNTAARGGGLWKGGYYLLELISSSVTRNAAAVVGAGIYGTGPGKNFKVVNSTIAYNTVTQTGSGAGIFSANAASTVLNSTIAYNTVPSDITSVGAAIHGTVKVTNTILLNNTGGWNNLWTCMGSVTNGGHNVQYPGDTCLGIPVADAHLELALMPALETLTFGQTQTLMPLPGSPAINQGAKCPKSDQRGVKRPQGAACDIGALEKEGTKPAITLIIAPLNQATGLPPQPVFTWGSVAGVVDYRLIVAKPSGAVVFTATLTPAQAGCAPECAYNMAASGKSLKPGKAYTLTVQARNEFGKSKSKVRFKTA